METPNILQYQEYRSFLRDFIDQNKRIDSKYSHRYFSRKLDWPDSLISDLISGRKTLSLNRCLQFSKLVDFDDFQTEYFVCLCIASSESQAIKAYINKVIGQRFDTSYFPSDAHPDISTHVDLVAVFDYLVMTKRFSNSQELVDALPILNLNASDVDTIIASLEEKEMIKINRETGVVQILSEDLAICFNLPNSREQAVKVFEHNTKNVINFINSPTKRFTLNSGFSAVSEHHYQQIESRLLAFKNWLLSLEKETKDDDKSEKRLFQYDLNFFPLSRKNNSK